MEQLLGKELTKHERVMLSFDTNSLSKNAGSTGYFTPLERPQGYLVSSTLPVQSKPIRKTFPPGNRTFGDHRSPNTSPASCSLLIASSVCSYAFVGQVAPSSAPTCPMTTTCRGLTVKRDCSLTLSNLFVRKEGKSACQDAVASHSPDLEFGSPSILGQLC